MTISKNKGIFSSPVLDGKEDSPSPFWCSKKPFARLVFLCYFEGTVPSGVQTPAPLKHQGLRCCILAGRVPSGVQTPAPLKHQATSYGAWHGRVPSGVQTPAPLKQSRQRCLKTSSGVPSGVQTPAPLKQFYPDLWRHGNAGFHQE